MKVIRSKENPQFKSFKKLNDSAKARYQAQQTVIDGIHLVEMYCQLVGKPHCVIVSEDHLQQSSITTLLKQYDLTLSTVALPQALFNELSPVKTPTGILAIIEIPQARTPHTEDCVLLLEDIQDPGNLGTLLRSAAAANVDSIYLSKSCCDIWSPKVLRAAMGAHFALTIVPNANLFEIVRRWHGLSVATTPEATHTIYESDFTQPTLFMIGNEGAGLSHDLIALAKIRCRIPMNSKIESLNAASAGTLCLFERVRQLS